MLFKSRFNAVPLYDGYVIENGMGSSSFKPVEFDGFKNKWARRSVLDKCLHRGIEVLLPFF